MGATSAPAGRTHFGPHAQGVGTEVLNGVDSGPARHSSRSKDIVALKVRSEGQRVVIALALV